MSRFPAHQPPPAAVVAELMRAGVSWGTAMAMERWKAEEVLELLTSQLTHETSSPMAKMARRGRI